MCFSGHRHIPINEIDEISLSLEKVVKELIYEGYQQFATGGALGFDTLVAKTVLRLMKGFSSIQLHLVLPCPEQTRGWGNAEIEEYEMLKRLANSVTYTSEKYIGSAPQPRQDKQQKHKAKQSESGPQG